MVFFVQFDIFKNGSVPFLGLVRILKFHATQLLLPGLTSNVFFFDSAGKPFFILYFFNPDGLPSYHFIYLFFFSKVPDIIFL